MSKTVTIPTIGANPYVVDIGGVKYSYPAGTEQTVPDAVAAVIANDNDMRPKEDPDAADLRFATIAQVKQMIEGGGGGGGAGLPDVTTDDNGMALLVSGGEWNKGALPQDTLHVPFAVAEVEGVPVVTTTAIFADTLAAVLAGKTAYADVTINNAIKIRLPLREIIPAADPTALVFVGVGDFTDPEEEAIPQVFEIIFAEGGCAIKTSDLVADMAPYAVAGVFGVDQTTGNANLTLNKTAAELYAVVSAGLMIKMSFEIPFPGRDPVEMETIGCFQASKAEGGENDNYGFVAILSDDIWEAEDLSGDDAVVIVNKSS